MNQPIYTFAMALLGGVALARALITRGADMGDGGVFVAIIPVREALRGVGFDVAPCFGARHESTA